MLFRSFQFLRGRVGLGLPPDLVRFEEMLPSPFDYPDRCLFAVPTDLPDPRADAGGHDRAVADAIVHLAHSTPEALRFSATDFNSYVTVSTADGAPRRDGGRMRASDAPGLGVAPRLDVLGTPRARWGDSATD